MLRKFKSIFRGRTPPPKVQVKARFDAAQTNHDNFKHWQAADFLSADAEASSEVRKTLRTRARYEISNNSYARGVVLTLANDSVGIGPRLQMLSDRDEINRQLEIDFMSWSREVRLAEKLRTIRMARCQDGEAFILLAQNPKLTNTNVKLDLQLIEADRVTNELYLSDINSIDGIKFDEFGNVKSYTVLKYHPAGDELTLDISASEIPAENMIHIFRMDRAGQHRGIPEITSALPLFAQLRRFTLAVLSAAESAANFAGILYTDAPANGEADSVDAMDLIQLERNMLLTMPEGWKMDQVDPKQPSTTYSEFKHEILNEIARCLNMPFNIAAGNSSGYNYASGRLDHQTYYKAIRVDQSFTENVVLDPILKMWLREYLLNNSIELNNFNHSWFWDGMEHVDPSKEATAQETKLRNLTTTLAHEYGRMGRDWETELRQIAKEQKLLKELGITTSEQSITTKEEGKEEDENE